MNLFVSLFPIMRTFWYLSMVFLKEKGAFIYGIFYLEKNKNKFKFRKIILYIRFILLYLRRVFHYN